MTACYLGFFAESTGFGRAAREHARALANAGSDFTARSVLLGSDGVVDVVPRDREASFLRRRLRRTNRHDTLIVHTPPPRFSLFRERGVRNIGVTAWETPEPPKSFGRELDSMDALWVPSTFSREALARLTPRPIVVVPHPVAVPAAGDGDSRELAGVPNDCFVFLGVLEWAERKNPVGLVNAFVKAFSGRRDVVLLLKLSFRYGVPAPCVVARVEKLRGSRPRHPRILLCTEELSASAMAQLYRRADAYV